MFVFLYVICGNSSTSSLLRNRSEKLPFVVRGLKVAHSLANKQVKVDCAGILEGLKVRRWKGELSMFWCGERRVHVCR